MTGKPPRHFPPHTMGGSDEEASPSMQRREVRSSTLPANMNVRMGGGSPEGGGVGIDLDAAQAQGLFRRHSFIDAYESYLDLSSVALLREEQILEDEEESNRLVQPETPSGPPQEGRRASLIFEKRVARSHSVHSITASEVPEEGASVSHAFFLFMKSFVGGAILSLPSAINQGGVILGSTMLLIVSMWNFYCMYLLYVAGYVTNTYTLGSLADKVGTRLSFATELSLFITQGSFCVTYFLFFTDCMAQALQWLMWCGGPDMASNTWTAVIITCLAGIFLPLSLVRKIEKFAVACLGADALLLGCILYVLYSDVHSIAANGPGYGVPWVVGSAVGQSLGTAIFTFEGVGMVLPVAGCMDKPHRFPRVLLLVFLVLTLVYVAFGSLAAVAYGASTKTTILLNLSQQDPASYAPATLQLAWCASILVTFPVQINPATTSLDRIFTSRVASQVGRCGLVICLAVVAYVFRDSFQSFIALSGCFCCLPLAFIYPPVIHLFLAAETTAEKIRDIVLVGAGLMAMIYVCFSVFYYANPEPDPPVCNRTG